MNHQNNIMPLALLSVGEEGTIVDINGGICMTQRIYEMGFTKTTKVKVLSSSLSGPILVKIRDVRIALGRDIAMKIMVRKNEEKM